MKIEIWGDFACPFCYMGETQLDRMVDELGIAEETQYVFRAYELDPKAPARTDETIQQHFMKAHDEDAEEADKQIAHIEKMASRLGLDYHYTTVQLCNTFDAHRLMKYAQAKGIQLQAVTLNFSLFEAYFVKNLLLSDRETLCDLAANVGFDRAEVMTMLTGDDYAADVRADEEDAEARKLDYVPYMLFPDGTVLQGVVSPGAMRKTLAELH